MTSQEDSSKPRRPGIDYPIRFINNLHEHPPDSSARKSLESDKARNAASKAARKGRPGNSQRQTEGQPSYMYPDEAYRSFLGQLAQALAKNKDRPGRPTEPQDLPIWTQQTTEEEKYIEVLLVSGVPPGPCVLLKIQRENAYLIGYKPSDPANLPRPAQPTYTKWYRFKDVDLPGTFTETNSEPLTFTGHYADLARFAKKSIKETALGREALNNAISTLAEPQGSGDQAQRAEALMVIIQMVCEAARYPEVADNIANVFRFEEGGRSIPPDDKMREQYNNWGQNSKQDLSRRELRLRLSET